MQNRHLILFWSIYIKFEQCIKILLHIVQPKYPKTEILFNLSLSLLFCMAERLERVPWIAPECVDTGTSISSTSDQWSFGVTLLEICNNGDLPISGSSLSEVRLLNNLPTATDCAFLHLCTCICNIKTFAPKQKERFYQRKGRLAEPSSPELAGFISRCLTYEPVERPSFRTVLRELPRISALLTVHLIFW